MWVYKTYKTRYREKDKTKADSYKKEFLPTNAVKRRIGSLPKLDLSRHEDRQLVGYCYLEYVK